MRSRDWSKALADRKTGYLAAGAERESFDGLSKQRLDWLSGVDREFVDESNRAYEIERDRGQRAFEEQQRAFRVARHNESVALTALANIEASKYHWQRGKACPRRVAARQQRHGDAEACRDARRLGSDRAQSAQATHP